MNTYQIEVTDTLNGEPNYCWVRQFTFRYKTLLGAVRQLAREYGTGWRFDGYYGETSRYNLSGACICAFITCED